MGEHFLRLACYKDINKILKKGIAGRVLGISGLPSMASIHLRDGADVIITKYPNVDVHNMPYEDETFDWVFADFVIEHIENPWQAVADIKRVLNPGGIMVLTTASLFEIHDAPVDLYRFTPDGLRILCKDFNKIHTCGSWGSKRIVSFMMDLSPGSWKRPEMKDRPTQEMIEMLDDDDPCWPVIVWVVAEK